MKIILHGNGPNTSTGYGVQAKNLLPELKAAGHNVAVSCNYGQQGSPGSWRGITMYPSGYEADDLLNMHAFHHFGGDTRGGWIVTLLDVWALNNPLEEFNVASWVPVDHDPVPRGVIGFFKRTGAVPIAMSRFGERLLYDAGLDPVYIPLSVDTTVFRPTPTVTVDGETRTARDLLKLPADAFVVGMVAMNKGWSKDRKGFNEALRAFSEFRMRHPEAILYLHTEMHGKAEGVPLPDLVAKANIPADAVRFVDQYAYRLGVPDEMMAATYTAFDVLLAPSHGEGFCVPLIEAQACGTPVIATNFSSQRELASPEYGAAGWLVEGQREYDPAQRADYVTPYIFDVLDKLEQAYASDLPGMAAQAQAFAAQYDSVTVFNQFWRPFLVTLEPVAPAAKPPMVDVAVIVPALRPENEERLYRSFAETNDGTAALYVVEHGTPTRTYAENVNVGYGQTSESFVCIVGDDCEFLPGWIEAARELSDRYDVIGTNDSEPGRTRNPEVAKGIHADHFLVRRGYVEELGSSLEGPGVLAPECYRHWWTDKEIVGLARARGVFAPCLESRIVHHHPGYDGREDLRQADPVYMAPIAAGEQDQRTFMARLPLIEMQRVGRAR